MALVGPPRHVFIVAVLLPVCFPRPFLFSGRLHFRLGRPTMRVAHADVRCARRPNGGAVGRGPAASATSIGLMSRMTVGGLGPPSSAKVAPSGAGPAGAAPTVGEAGEAVVGPGGTAPLRAASTRAITSRLAGPDVGSTVEDRPPASGTWLGRLAQGLAAAASDWRRRLRQPRWRPAARRHVGNWTRQQAARPAVLAPGMSASRLALYAFSALA